MTKVDSVFAKDKALIIRYYPTCRYKLDPTMEQRYLEIVEYLQKDTLSTIEIRCHTDYRDTEESNAAFTLRMSLCGKSYLIKKGLDSTRVSAIGVGEVEPIVVSEELNKTYCKFEVGKVLDEKYIKTFDPEWQEIANGLNRRTEIRLIRRSK